MRRVSDFGPGKDVNTEMGLLLKMGDYWRRGDHCQAEGLLVETDCVQGKRSGHSGPGSDNDSVSWAGRPE